MLDPPQSEDPVLALLLDEQEALAEEWVQRDRERAQEAREWTTPKHEREAA